MGMAKRGKGDHLRFPATDMGMRLWGLGLISSRRNVFLPAAYLLAWDKQFSG